MRVRNRFALLALVAGTLAMTSPATGEGWFREMDDAKVVTLGEVLKNPRAYVNVDVRVKLYYNSPGGAYNPYFTRFTEEMYGNFSAWPIDARLYEKRDYRRSYHFFFVKRVNPAWKKIQKLERMTAVEVHATVREVFRGQAWLEVFDFETVSEGLTSKQVREVIAGDAYSYAGRHSEAARHYSRAVSSRQPESVQADIYRRLADSRFHAGDYRGALSSYRDALENEPESAVLQRGIDASKAAVARSKRKGEAGAETLLPAPRHEPLTARQSSVDVIINLLEDPAHVEAEVEAWRLELEKRSAIARGDAGVEAVSGTEPAAEAAPAPEAAPEEGCGPAIVEDDGSAEAAQPEITVPEDAGDTASGSGETATPAPAGKVRQPFVTEPPEGDAGATDDACGVDDAEACAADACATDSAEATDAAEATEVEEATDVADDAEACAAETTDTTDTAEATEANEAAEVTEDAEACAADTAETAEGCADDAAEALEGCGEESAEDSADGCAETADTPADDTAEGMFDESSEGCAADDEGVWWEDTTGDETGMEGCGEEVVVVEAGDETTTNDPRIVQVADVVVRLTRLPFYGCEEVTFEDWRAVVEEIVLNPEN